MYVHVTTSEDVVHAGAVPVGAFAPSVSVRAPVQPASAPGRILQLPALHACALLAHSSRIVAPGAPFGGLHRARIGGGHLQPGLLDALTSPQEAEQLGPWLLPHSGGYRDLDAAGYQRLLPLQNPGSFRTISLRTLAAGDTEATQSLSGEIVLIGSTAPSLRDLFEIPQSRFIRTERQLRMPGVEVHALRVAALLDGLGEPWALKTLPPWSDRGLELLAILGGIHAAKCNLGCGMFFLLQECTLVLMHRRRACSASRTLGSESDAPSPAVRG